MNLEKEFLCTFLLQYLIENRRGEIMRKRFLANFPGELFDQAVSFEISGKFLVTWRAEVVEKVIDWIKKNNAAVLGGQVFERAEGIFFLTGLEWNVERNERDWNE